MGTKCIRSKNIARPYKVGAVFLNPYHASSMCIKVKVTSFGKDAFSYSTVQPSFDILTSPGHWATLGN